MSYSCFNYLPIDGHLGCFHILVIVSNAAMNTGVFMFFWVSILGSFKYIPRSRINGSKGRSIFNFLRYLHTAFHSGCTSLHSHQQYERVRLSPHPGKHCLIIDGSRYDGCVIISHCDFNCISLVIGGVEHIFICLLATCMFSLKKCLFRSFAHFFWIVCFLVWSFISSL